MTIGSCLLANELEGMGKEMLEMRIKGESWAIIAQKFNLPNPSAARTKFTKLTGITDYKAKGQTLVNLANDASSKASKTGIFAAKQATKKAKKALDIDDPMAGFSPSQKNMMSSVAESWGMDSDEYKDTLKFLQNKNAKKKAEELAQKLTPEVPETIKPIPGTSQLEAKGKWKSNQQLIDDTGLSPAQVGEIIEKNQQGSGYLAIKNATGADFKQIDDVVWNSLLKKHDGDVWKAYKSKPTSQNGFDAVKDSVMAKKKLGMSNADISKLHDMPEEVVDAISKGTWKLPSPGSATPYIPPAPPKPAATFRDVPEGFPFRSSQSMLDWISEDTANLPSPQRSAISNYTGSDYHSINEYLRGGYSYDTSAVDRTVSNLDKSMRPMPFNTRVVRHVSGTEVFGTTNLETMVGKVIRDKGFLSTTIKETGVFTSGNVRMIIDVPQGAKARYVQDISMHKSEQELLLARGSHLKIKAVERGGESSWGGNRWTVYMEVIP